MHIFSRRSALSVRRLEHCVSAPGEELGVTALPPPPAPCVGEAEREPVRLVLASTDAESGRRFSVCLTDHELREVLRAIVTLRALRDVRDALPKMEDCA